MQNILYYCCMKDQLQQRAGQAKDYFKSIEIKSYMPLLEYANPIIRGNDTLKKKIGRVMSDRVTSNDEPIIMEIERGVDYLKEHGYK